jgi:hypothetical protein
MRGSFVCSRHQLTLFVEQIDVWSIPFPDEGTMNVTIQHSLTTNRLDGLLWIKLVASARIEELPIRLT